MNNSVLLTGGAGYIGSHTAVELINTGYNVVIVDDLSNSQEDVIDRIEKITGYRPSFYKCNCSDYTAMDKIFAEHNVGAVIHFAGYKAVGESVEKPIMYYRNNIDSALTVLELMNKHDVKRFVFSSSATVYGSENPSPYIETLPTGNCTSPYGKTKYFIEEILKDTASSNNAFSAVALRYFNPIGAHESGLLGEKPNGIPNNLMPYITQVAVGLRDKLNIFGNDYPTHDGTGVRDYIHVVDLAKGHVAALNYAEKHVGFEAINLGTGIGYSVLDIVKAFEKANHLTIPFVFAPRRDGDLAAYFSDPSKAQRLLGWQTEKTLEDMCLDSWRWQKYISESR